MSFKPQRFITFSYVCEILIIRITPPFHMIEGMIADDMAFVDDTLINNRVFFYIVANGEKCSPTIILI